MTLRILLLELAAAIGTASAPALAQVEPERCPRFIAGNEARVIPAAFDVAQLHDGEVRLHHTLTREHLDALGRIDVVLVPVDGGYTLNVDDMVDVLGQVNAPLVIPMHYFGQSTLARFLARLDEDYAVEFNPLPVVTLSRATLPRERTVLVLPGY